MRPQPGASLFDHPAAKKLLTEKLGPRRGNRGGGMAGELEGRTKTYHNRLFGQNVVGQDPNAANQTKSKVDGATKGGNPLTKQKPAAPTTLPGHLGSLANNSAVNNSQAQPFGKNESKGYQAAGTNPTTQMHMLWNTMDQ